MSGNVVSARGAAELVGVNERTIRNAISAGELPAVKGPDGWAIDPSELYAWKGRKTARKPPPEPVRTPQAELVDTPESSAPPETGLSPQQSAFAIFALAAALDRAQADAREAHATALRLAEDKGALMQTVGVLQERLAVAEARTDAPPAAPTRARRSWLRRLFGGDKSADAD